MRRWIGALVVPAVALGVSASPISAQTVVPPGNSAVNQYTETFPTSHGNQPTTGGGHVSPQATLGARNAKRLEAAGPEGRAAAELAAATAPTGAGGEGARPGGSGSSAGGRGGSGGASGNAGGSVHAGASAGGSHASSGGSGLGSVIGQATGTSSGGHLGLVLPLLLFGILAWAAAYSWRRRRA